MSKHFFIAGPCAIESEEIVLKTAEKLARIREKYHIELIFKSSFDKANRTRLNSFRGAGLTEGLRILQKVKEQFDFTLTTDIHLPDQAMPVAEVVDIIQIPAFLCRQTDLLVAAARTSKVVNIKKGQFMAPWDMQYAAEKVILSGNGNVWITERGVSFGYNNLVVDFRSLRIMKPFAKKIIYDVTHSMQIPSRGGISGGTKEFAGWLAFAAASVGADGLFFEVHPEPQKALSDASVMLSLDEFERLIDPILAHWDITDSYENNP